VKSNWLQETERIIDDAVRGGTLRTNSSGEFIGLDDCKQGFLRSLDLRHLGDFTAPERKALGPKIVELVLGASEELPAVRLTSLLLWYTYVEGSRSQRPKVSGSDIGDHFSMSLIPYCPAFCVDKTMKRILACMKPHEQTWSCEILDKALLEKRLLASRGHGNP
jgi:hypothetical protein